MQAMEWANWQCALLVARLGTVAAAAVRLNVDATTVSRRVKRLEEKLGTRIFEREGMRLRATNSFLEALAKVEAAELALRSAEDVVGNSSSRMPRRPLRITAVPFLVDCLLVPGLAMLRQRANFRIELIADNRNLSLTRREADIAVRFDSPRERSGAVSRRLGAIGYAVYAPANPITSSLELPWATLEDVYAHLPEARWTAKHAGKVKWEFKTNRTETIRELVGAGLAKALLPQVVGERDPRLLRVSGEAVLRRNVSLIMLAGESQTPQLEAATQWLEKLFSQPNAIVLGLNAATSP